jgi:hypothetical protein
MIGGGHGGGCDHDDGRPHHHDDPNAWLPPPLQRAHPKYIRFTEQALGVIVEACKMCPGGETWEYVLTPYHHYHHYYHHQ